MWAIKISKTLKLHSRTVWECGEDLPIIILMMQTAKVKAKIFNYEQIKSEMTKSFNN